MTNNAGRQSHPLSEDERSALVAAAADAVERIDADELERVVEARRGYVADILDGLVRDGLTVQSMGGGR